MISQVFFSVAAGKRLIAKGIAANEAVEKAAREHTLVIIKGTTNAYVAQEVLAANGLGDFDGHGFFRGTTKPESSKLSAPVQPCDLLIKKGELIKDKTIFDVADELQPEDMILKGANAIHLPTGTVGVLVASPKAGTILPIMSAAAGRHVKLLQPMGVEKRVDTPIAELSQEVNRADEGLRLFPTSGIGYTEIDAIRELFGLEATICAAGGIGGYEGGCYFLIKGDPESVEKCKAFADKIKDEPLFAL